MPENDISTVHTIVLSDGTKIENLRLNGNNYVSESVITEEQFNGKLSSVQDLDSDGNVLTTFENAELVQVKQYSDGYYFILREIPAEELAQKKLRADIDYLALMTDNELE